MTAQNVAGSKLIKKHMALISQSLIRENICGGNSPVTQVTQEILARDGELSVGRYRYTGRELARQVNYNLCMAADETLDEFVQILGRIKDLVGEATISDDDGIDLAEAIERLRLSGNNKGADELAELIERADELKAQHQVGGSRN